VIPFDLIDISFGEIGDHTIETLASQGSESELPKSLALSSPATLSILTPDERYPPPKQHLEYEQSH
jgi:hypothetical protein